MPKKNKKIEGAKSLLQAPNIKCLDLVEADNYEEVALAYELLVSLEAYLQSHDVFTVVALRGHILDYLHSK